MNSCTYLMPIRRAVFNAIEAEALARYLAEIRAATYEIIVVDGSPPAVFAAHHELWFSLCRHERVDNRFGCLNDKVNGIHTGVRLATTEKIVLADDDIRYTPENIHQIAGMLDEFEVVRPQNYFGLRAGESGNSEGEPRLPAMMEAARMLINRATLRTADYPGTCAFRRAAMLTAGAYDGDVLFDNEELIRHLARSGAHICYANDVFIRKQPPTFRKWIEQRPRQAYEDFGLRAKTAVFAILPLLIVGSGVVMGTGAMFLFALILIAVAFLLALIGRCRGAAARFFPLAVCFVAPLWIFERSLSTYWAFYWFVRYGGYPFGDRLLHKGIGRDWAEGGRIAAQTITRVDTRK